MSLTCVSCFFQVKGKHTNYFNWFANTLAVNCPYVFFTDNDTIDIIKQYRGDLPTYYIICELNDLYMYQYKDRIATDPVHCPSIEVNMIWNEKIFMMEKAVNINPFQSEWFKWMDAGMSIYRHNKPPPYPFPVKERLIDLPTDKFIYSASDSYIPDCIREDNYYHHISGTFLFHKNFISIFVDVYKQYLEKLLNKNNIWTEQVIYTHIYKEHPELFYKLCDGYGTISLYLYGI